MYQFQKNTCFHTLNFSKGDNDQILKLNVKHEEMKDVLSITDNFKKLNGRQNTPTHTNIVQSTNTKFLVISGRFF